MVGRILPLAQAVRQHGHDVHLLTLSGSTKEPFQANVVQDGVTIRTVGPNMRATGVASPSLSETWRRFRAGQSALADALALEAADVMVLAKPQLQNITPTLAAARARGTPLLLDADDFEPTASRFPILVHMHMQGLDARAARTAKAITACSPFLVEHYRRLNPRAQVEFIPTSITAPSNVPPARLRERLGIAPDAKVILYAGSLSLSSAHRVDALLDAFSQLTTHNSQRNIHLVLAGDGLDEHKLRTMAYALCPKPEHIHFLGHFTPPEDVARAYGADLLVDPVDRSATAEAKSSHRLMLALATGTPIVMGNVGIRPVLLPQALHARCLYDPAQSKGLVEALERGLHSSTRVKFQQATRGVLKMWDWNTLGKRFTALLESLSF
jgi:glycosyltransferase involved in cell wall biosynthesis